MPRKMFLAALLISLSFVLSAGTALAQDDPAADLGGLDIYGYLVNCFNVASENCGDQIYLRLKGDWKPAENLSFHLELANTYWMGNLNPYAILPGVDQSAHPLEDFTREFRLDHYWGSVTFDRFSLQFGQVPLAWGTAYVFNPTSKASVPAMLDMVAEETPGTPAIVPSYAFDDRFSLQGYLAFQEKLGKKTASRADGEPANLPYGLKLQATTGKFDWSVGWIKEVLYLDDGYHRNYYLCGDFVGAIGNVGIYGEAAVNLPRNAADSGFDFDQFDLEEQVALSLGGDYYLEGLETTIRFEFHHQGRGEEDKADYDLGYLLSGELAALAEDYFFLAAEKEYSAYYSLTVAALVNLNDRSYVFFPEFSYQPDLDFTVTLGALIFGGPAGSEYNGVFDLGAGEIDLTNSAIYIKCELSF